MIVLFQRREDIVPDKVQFRLHILQIGGVDHNGVLCGNNNDILSAGAVGAIGVVTTAPHLVAVALNPIAIIGRQSAFRDFIGPNP